MGTYIHYTQEQKDKARSTDLVDLLERQGERLKRSGNEYQWRDGSNKVTIRGNLWYHQYEEVGGDAIDFVRKFYNKDYPEAMEYLLNGYGGTLTAAPPIQQKEKAFIMPERNENMRRVYAYLLHKRGINREIINAFAHKNMIYESLPHHNAVFVGYDSSGEPRHAHKRGSGSQSTYKGNAEGSMPEYSFHWNGTSDKLFLFEAPIDMLSYISMNPYQWQKNTYAASCSVADRVLFQCLKDNPTIREIYLCLDNDEAGQTAAKRISDKLFVMGYKAEILTPIHKDWNEDLNYLQKEGEPQWTTQLS
ncbi:MAG: DUF3991 domain-containing protein [Bacteroidaceae bacterium]|nr:DUF3991 domain-containing protein [Bacteroidaceae bacterium]